MWEERGGDKPGVIYFFFKENLENKVVLPHHAVWSVWMALAFKERFLLGEKFYLSILSSLSYSFRTFPYTEQTAWKHMKMTKWQDIYAVS